MSAEMGLIDSSPSLMGNRAMASKRNDPSGAEKRKKEKTEDGKGSTDKGKTFVGDVG